MSEDPTPTRLRDYAVTVTCEAGCEHDEAFTVVDYRTLTRTHIDAVLFLCDVELPRWNEAKGMPLVGKVQETLARLVGVLPQLEGISPEDQALATYLTIGSMVLVRDSILAHRFAETTVSVEAIEEDPWAWCEDPECPERGEGRHVH